jgi:hypothetical protein
MEACVPVLVLLKTCGESRLVGILAPSWGPRESREKGMAGVYAAAVLLVPCRSGVEVALMGELRWH